MDRHRLPNLFSLCFAVDKDDMTYVYWKQEKVILQCLVYSYTLQYLKKPCYFCPGTGSLLTAVEIGTQKKAITCGKPEKPIFDVLVQEQNVDPAKTIMIGDR